MSYTTHVRGEFTITPPLSWPEFKDSPFYSATGEWDDLKRDVILLVSEDTNLVDASLIRRTATALAFAEISEYREENLVEHVQEAVDAFPGHTFTGRLECEGEEDTDMWRVVIRDGRAVRVEPTITWPDESDD